MDIPCDEDGFTLDANCCIEYALRFGKKALKEGAEISFYSEPLLKLVNKCCEKNIIVGYFPFIESESYRNITKAVNERCAKVKKYYLRSKFNGRARANLDRLFQRLEKLEGRYTPQDFSRLKKLFIDNEVNVKEVCDLYHEKENIPEDNDIKLIICAHNQDWNSAFLASDDCHFTAYKELIEKKYTVNILPMDKILAHMIEWKWII